MGTQIGVKCDRCGLEGKVELGYDIWEYFVPNRFDMTPVGMKAFSCMVAEVNDFMFNDGFCWCDRRLICKSCYKKYETLLDFFKQERADRIRMFWANGSISA